MTNNIPSLLTRFALLLCATAVAVGAQAPDDPLIPDAEPIARDVRQVYVSSSDGDDARPGQTPDTAVATLARAMDLMRDGHADEMLLKRGDRWTAPFGHWTLSGESPEAPMVIGYYGEEGARPAILTTADNSALTVPLGADVSNLKIHGIHFEAFDRTPSSPAFSMTDDRPVGIRWDGSGKDITFDDCTIRSYTVGVLLAGTEGEPVQDVTFRHCLVAECYGDEDSHGLWAVYVQGLTLDQCVLDMNGWHPIARRSGEDLERRIDNAGLRTEPTTTGVTVTNSVITQCSGAGLDLGSGGTVERCVLAGNSIGVRFGWCETPAAEGAQGKVTGCVFARGADPTDDTGGRGVVVTNARGVEIKGNVFTENLSRSHEEAFAVHVFGKVGAEGIGSKDVLIQNNTTWDWGGYRLQPTMSVRMEMAAIHILDNLFLCPTRADVLGRMDVSKGPQYKLARNIYMSAAPQNAWFMGRTAKLGCALWAKAVGEQWSDTSEVQFNDEERTLGSFDKASGGAGGFGAFVRTLRERAIGEWPEKATAAAVIEYFLEGFTPSERPTVNTAGASPFTTHSEPIAP